MFSYTTKCVNILTIIIISIIAIPIFMYDTNNTIVIQNQANIVNETQEIQKEIDTKTWKLVIPKLELEAEIEEGTSEEVMNKYIGHFTETSKLKGNVGLAAHNRGYPVNYFEKLYLLIPNDIIFYRAEGELKIYKVTKSQIIKDTDWSYLKHTEEDKLTLITCMRNMPDYRLCVQATSIEEDL